MGERLAVVANVLSGRRCQQGFSKWACLGSSERTEFLEAVLNERVKEAERVLETMEDFGERVCV